jgi:hypothetical protein
MNENNPQVLRNVAWSEMLPWLILYRSLRLAITGFRMMVMGAIAVFLTALCWWFISSLFPLGDEHPATKWLMQYNECPWRAVTESVPNVPPVLPRIAGATKQHSLMEMRGEKEGARLPEVPAASEQLSQNPWQEPYTGSWSLLSRPAWEALVTNLGFRDLICLALCGLLSLIVWAFFGGAISRIAAVQLAAGERVHLAAALRFAVKHFLSYLGAPLLLLGGALIVTVLTLAVSWLLHWGFGVFIVGIFWPLLLIGGLVMVLLLVGLFFGWPLMWSTVSTEGSDSFDAISRSFAYVYQRPLHYAFYIAVAAFLGWLGWIVVENFAAGVIYLTYWTASWATGTASMEAIRNGNDLGGWFGNAGVAVIHFWTGCVKLLAVGFGFAYLFSASAAIYLLQRRHVDAAEMDEVFLDADATEPEPDLPKIVADAAGAPEVQETTSEKSEGKPAAE